MITKMIKKLLDKSGIIFSMSSKHVRDPMNSLTRSVNLIFNFKINK